MKHIDIQLAEKELEKCPLIVREYVNALKENLFVPSKVPITVDKTLLQEGFKFAQWFAEKHCPPELPSHKKNQESWAREYEMLRRIDRKTKEQIKDAVIWSRSDEFWSNNFKSPLKLRKKNSDGIMYIDVFLAKASESKKKQHNPATDATQGLGYDDTKGGNGKVWNAAIGKYRYPADWKGPRV